MRKTIGIDSHRWPPFYAVTGIDSCDVPTIICSYSVFETSVCDMHIPRWSDCNVTELTPMIINY